MTHSEETKLSYVVVSNNQYVKLRRQPLCNYKEAIFILVGHAVSKATWCNPGIPAKPRAGASGVPDAILTLWRAAHSQAITHWVPREIQYSCQFISHCVSELLAGLLQHPWCCGFL